MVEKIEKYLEAKKKDYDQGLIILSKATKNRILVQRLSRKQWPEKLNYELKKCLERLKSLEQTSPEEKSPVEKSTKPLEKKDVSKNPSENIPIIKEPKRVRIIKNDQKVKFEDLPEELQKKWDENALMYKEARSLHEKLKLLAEAKDEDRQPLITRLGMLSDKVRANWDIIDNYDPDSKPGEKNQNPEIDPKRISANRKYISMNAGKLKKNPKPESLRAKIQERINELLSAGETFKDDHKIKLEEMGLEFKTVKT